MKLFKPKSLITRLLWSVTLPELFVFALLAWVSFIELANFVISKNEHQQEIIYNEILSHLKLLDVSTNLIGEELNLRTEKASREIAIGLKNHKGLVEDFDLESILVQLDLDANNSDIYIINREGIIVNTTFEKDLGIETFKFGVDFKNFLLSVMDSRKFVAESFTIETRTGRLKKYSYLPTEDGNYLVQIGLYSDGGDSIMQVLKSAILNISEYSTEISETDIILSSDNPFSFTNRKLSDTALMYIDSTFKLGTHFKRNYVETDTLNPDKQVHYQSRYYYVKRENTSIFRSVVIQITHDVTVEQTMLEFRVLQKIFVFTIGLIILFLVLLVNGRQITKPIKILSESSEKIGSGNLKERVPIRGSKELRKLANSFNMMAINLEKADKEIRDAHNEIKSSINYARRIQEAILPPAKLVKSYLTESFILYKPKDIVAGDFYWFDVQGNDVYFAAADCTGHGVPGAMVSVVCANALNRAVNEMKLSEPAEILNKVRELVVQTFEKSEEEVKDGMDISFCKLNLKTNKLVYAGAHNPLYHVTPITEVADVKTLNNETHMLLEYKGDKQPIGKWAFEKSFTQQEIQLLEGDSIYLSTDGYADQFGGEHGKKFMYKPFKQLFLSLQNESMEKQKELLSDSFEKWRSSHEQVDDVCVIGVRV